jgi:hypothetical protein
LIDCVVVVHAPLFTARFTPVAPVAHAFGYPLYVAVPTHVAGPPEHVHAHVTSAPDTLLTTCFSARQTTGHTGRVFALNDTTVNPAGIALAVHAKPDCMH